MNNRLIAIVCFVVLIALGSFQGRRLGHVREAEAFYRWMLAAATNERLLGDTHTEYKDGELYAEVLTASEAALKDLPADPAKSISKFSQLTENTAYDDVIFNLARGEELRAQREKFFELVPKRELEYARGIQYADALADDGTSVPLFSMYFGFRKVAANFVWIQVDRYWHQGMMHRMIPLMKTCVTLDPQFIDAYLLGAWHLAYNVTAKMNATPMPQRKWDEHWQACIGEKESFYYIAADFLKRGILNNPREYKLYFDLGFAVYKNKLEDYPNAVRYLAEATRLPHEKWVPRQLYICLELNKQYEEAKAGWTQFLERYPEHEVAKRFIPRNDGHIAEQKAEAAKAAALAATDPAEAEMHMQESEKYLAEARRIWKDLNEPFSDSRLMRLDAIAFAEQGRYREAIAYLEKARMESSGLFWEASELIIQYKHAAGIALSTSEKLAELRKQDGDRCEGQPAPNQSSK
ncbi:MAG: tetratricopeptide repeat protein [Candidatus Hydrogenedentes bacterium]|nr:tetratricopeptide repeat protein [Candidatus Hydrogenedentota bacterium]